MQARHRHSIMLTAAALLISVGFPAVGQSVPEMTSPTPGSTLAGSSVTFAWSANGISVDRWWLYVGSTAGARDIVNSGSLTTTSYTATGLPTTGATIHVRLWFDTGSWSFVDYQYQTGSVDCPCFTVAQLDALYDQLVAGQGRQIADCMEQDYSASQGYPPYTYYYVETCVGSNATCDLPQDLVAGVAASHAYVNGERHLSLWDASCYINDLLADEHVLYESNLNHHEVAACGALFKASKWGRDACQ